MRVIPIKELFSDIKDNEKRIKNAAVRTLNTIGFDAQKEMVEQAGRDMKFRTNVRRAMGLRVKKARTSNITVEVATNRGWLISHLSEGTRTPDRGFRYNNRPFILVPVEPKAFTKKNRLKTGYRRNLYIIPNGRDGLVFYRQRRGPRTSELIGVLKPRVRHNEDTDPQKVFNETFKNKATRLFNFYINRA